MNARPLWIVGRRWTGQALLAGWIGGLTLYASAVVPIAHRVLDDARAQGFVTREVTACLNVAAALSLLPLGWTALADGRAAGRALRIWLYGSGLLLAAAVAALFALHPRLDAFLDPALKAVAERGRFHRLHEVYLIVTTVQWVAGLLHLGASIAAGRAADRAEASK
jgi:hypothetical protein